MSQSSRNNRRELLELGEFLDEMISHIEAFRSSGAEMGDQLKSLWQEIEDFHLENNLPIPGRIPGGSQLIADGAIA
jgi:hypothetical protein